MSTFRSYPGPSIILFTIKPSFLTLSLFIVLLLSFTPFLDIEIILVLFFILILKILGHINHFLSLLILIERVLMFTFFLLNIFSISYLISAPAAFLLIVIMVIGACLGLSMIVVVRRSFSKNLEITKLKL